MSWEWDDDMRYEFLFVPTQCDGDIPSHIADSLDDLGTKGWHIVGIINDSSYIGFPHTLIMQRELRYESD